MENSRARFRDLGAPLTLLHPIVAVCLVLSSGCAMIPRRVHQEMKAAAATNDPLAVSDALEALIAQDRDRAADRSFALTFVREHAADTAAAKFACASVAGRYVQQRGLLAVQVLSEIEECARRSRQLDPSFRDGAATRLLGSVYVMAPAQFVKYGNSETGIDMLEEMVDRNPQLAENHLRLAEGYIALGDAASAVPHLCMSQLRRAQLRPDESKLLDQLLRAGGHLNCEATAAQAATPPPTPSPTPEKKAGSRH